MTQEQRDVIDRLCTSILGPKYTGVSIHDRQQLVKLMDIYIWKDMACAPKKDNKGKAIYLQGYCPDEGVTPEACIMIIWWEEAEGKWFAEGQCDDGVRPTKWTYLVAPPEDR